MSISSSIFKAYDIRGIVDDTLTEDAAYCVAHACVVHWPMVFGTQV